MLLHWTPILEMRLVNCPNGASFVTDWYMIPLIGNSETQSDHSFSQPPQTRVQLELARLITIPLRPADTCVRCTCSRRRQWCSRCACSRWPASAGRPRVAPSRCPAGPWGRNSVWCADGCTAPLSHWCPARAPCPIFRNRPPKALSLVAVDSAAKASWKLGPSLEGRERKRQRREYSN